MNATVIKSTYNKALKLAQQGHLSQAASLLDGLALQAPTLPEIHVQRARLAGQLGQAQKRQSAIDTALKLRPKDPTILSEAIATYTALDNDARVLDLYDALIALHPKAIKHKADKALYLQRSGHFDASEKLFRQLLKKHPNDAELYRMFAATHRFTPGDPLIGAMRKLAKHPKLPPQGQMHVGFALAKAMEDTKQTASVFPALRRANAAQAALWPDDPGARHREWQAVVDAQHGLKPLNDTSDTHPNMVFVTGFPRSGTTLVEQIIASHSQAKAGGELTSALRTAYALFGAGQDMLDLATLDDKTLRQFPQKLLLANTAHAAPDRTHLTDKSIMAFLIYGLLHATLPNARFIVVHRDPRDMAVSMFKNHFAGGTHRYTNDLAAIADAIKSFRGVIRHWRDALPDRFTELSYEDLVSHPEDQSKKLIMAAGLEWEEQCLDFHKRGGTVKTLSLHQVRQPIYQSSSAAWRKYEAELQPFFDAWGDTPWD